MSTKQNRTIITTTEQVTPLLLLSAMGREVNGICLEWISAPVDKHGETYDWKCGISAGGRMIQAEAETGPLGVIEAGLADMRLQVDQMLHRAMIARKAAAEAERERGGEEEKESLAGLIEAAAAYAEIADKVNTPRPRRILIVGPDDGTTKISMEDHKVFDLIASAENKGFPDVLEVIKNRYGPIGSFLPCTIFKAFGIHTTKPETEVDP